jgi:hypothetical protein
LESPFAFWIGVGRRAAHPGQTIPASPTRRRTHVCVCEGENTAEQRPPERRPHAATAERIGAGSINAHHWPGRSLSREAVAQTNCEAAESLLRRGSEIGHLDRRGRSLSREGVPEGGSGVDFRGRAASFLRRLSATASRAGERVGGRAPRARKGLP